MIQIAQAALILWLPIVIMIFASRPPRQAVIISYVVAWLFLPRLTFPMSGIPDYNKMAATTIGVLLATLIFDSRRYLTLRPRLFDLPIVGWCIVPFFSAFSFGLGAYEGASATLFQLFAWGLPYLIGRLYLNDLKAGRDLAVGMVIGGLAYLPLCLIEIRMAPIFDQMIYGLVRWEGTRYGGFRPRLFMETGLEVGTWMSNVTLISYWLWASNSVRHIRGVGIGRITLALLVTTVLCKATGALVLMLMGMGVLWLSARIRMSWPVWIILLIPPIYESTRFAGIWTGREVVAASDAVFGAERAESLDFRLMNEDKLLVRAKMHPWLGWGRFGGFQEYDKNLKPLQILDGYWLITLGFNGGLGLASMTAAWLLPLLVMVRRQPVSTWSRPEFGATAVLCMVVALYMVDNLSNAMINPIYGLVLGGLVPQILSRREGDVRTEVASLKAARALMEEGRAAEADPEFRRAIAIALDRPEPQGQAILAEALEGLGDSLMATGLASDAEIAYRESNEILESQVDGPAPSPELAIAREKRARALSEIGRSAEAIGLRRLALTTWDQLARARPTDPEIRDHRRDALNDLAWLLVADPDPALREPSVAARLAEEAALSLAGPPATWNTLGVARYRSGRWAEAIVALERSAKAAPGGGTAFDHYFLAMAYHQTGDEAQAISWLDRADAWTRRHRPGHATLARFRQEAVALILGRESTPDDLR